ncbi:MAG: glutathione S-transferase family protein [Pseudomonadota bacterium]
MAVFASTSQEAKGLRGLHLYHFKDSNCSQRCRIALEAKRLPWRSHHIDISQKENLAPAYVEINPNGVVPTLVHDGVVMLESNDIIDYLDERFRLPPLMPDDEREQDMVRHLMLASTRAQSAIKVLSHEHLFSARREFAAAEADTLVAQGGNQALAEFLHDYAENGERWSVRLAAAESEIDSRLEDLETRLLDTAGWLSGVQFGLADISWVVNYHRLQRCGYTFADFPQVLAWGDNAVSHPAFVAAVTDYLP